MMIDNDIDIADFVEDISVIVDYIPEKQLTFYMLLRAMITLIHK